MADVTAYEPSASAASPAAPDNPAHFDADRPAEAPWPVLYALFTSWWRPSATTRRMAHVSLPRAYVIHILGILLTVFVVTLYNAWAFHADGDMWATPFYVSDSVGGYFVRFVDEPGAAIAETISWLVATEVAVLALCAVVMPFGARRERWRDSARHAVRRTWLHTPHAVIVLTIIAIMSGLTHGADDWWRARRQASFERTHPMPTGEVDRAEYRQEEWEYVYAVGDPWFVRVAPVAFAVTMVGCGVWLFGALLRGITAARPVRCVAEQPICRACGYDLTGLPPDGRCPECGREAQSASTGCAWNRRQTVGRLRAYISTAYRAVFYPAGFAEGLDPAAPRSDSIRFFCVTLVLLGLAVGGVFAPVEFVIEWMQDVGPLGVGAVEDAIYFAGTVVAFVALAVGLLTFITGSVVTLQQKRNALPGIARHAAYTSVMFLPWMLVWSAAYTIVLASQRLLEALSGWLGQSAGLIVIISWWGAEIIGVVLYAGIVACGAPGVRYAQFD